MKTLAEYANQINKVQQSPDLLADLLSEMTAHYSYLTEQHTKLKLDKAVFENRAKFIFTQDGQEVEREKPLSDKSVEQKWRITKAGQKEYTLKRTLNAMEKMMANLRSVLSQRKTEHNNSNN